MADKSITDQLKDLGFAVYTMTGPRPPGVASHDAIVASEAAGQAELVNSTLLPFKTNGQGHQPFLDVGIKLGDTVVDELFVEAELPEGWEKRPAPDHNMWSYIYDQHGRLRINVFYKAAVYDRRAHMKLQARFSAVEENQIPDNWKCPRRFTVADATATEPHFATDWYSGDDYEASSKAKDECEAWLDENYPEWKNAAAYWEDAA
jgi:hypothetical protein